MSNSNCRDNSTYMTIYIETLKISAIIGILDFERITPQDIVVDATIDYCYKNSDFINYAEVIALIETEIIEKKYELLEDALTDISKLLTNNYSQIKKMYLKISKPSIISNAKVALSINLKNQ